MAIAAASLTFHFGKFPIRQTNSFSIQHRIPSGRGFNLYYPRASHRFARFGFKCSLTDTDVHLDHVTTDEDEGQGRGVVEPLCPVPFVNLKTDILETESLNLLAEATFVDTLLTTLPVLSEEEQHALSATPAHQVGLHAFYASCIAANVVEQLWNFAWPSAIALIHPSLLPVAVMGFFTKVTIIVGGPLVGRVMDHFPRMYAYNCLTVVQAAAQLLSSAMIIHAHSVRHTSLSSLLLRPWFFILVSAGAIERLCGVALGVANERDWVVLLAGVNRPIALAQANAVLNRIDLLCEIAGALLFGFLLSKFHPVICLKVASGLMMGLLPVTIIFTYLTNKLSTGVLDRPKPSQTCCRTFIEDSGTDAKSIVFKGLEAIKLGWKEYLGQPVLPASLAWVLLYFNVVLTPGSLLTAFLTQRGLHPSIIGGFSGMCAVMGVAATFVSSTLVEQFGILKAGAVGLVFQALLLSMAVAVYLSGSISYQSPLLTFLFLIILSRLGHMSYDVVGAQIIQTGIPSSKANLIGTTEIAVASLAESIMLGVAIIANDPSHFGCLALLSLLSVIGAAWMFCRWLLNPTDEQKNLFSYDPQFEKYGCCGGLHFGDVLCLDLVKMNWSKLGTTGEKPGPRDSHGAVLVGHKMIVFGGTNGLKKVNDTHILDLVTKEWIRPKCEGTPPSPRESHTATLVGDERVVIFGGSGEGDGNYLNDLHVLDLRTMRWTSPQVKGDLPVPRDSHSTLAIGNRLFVYGGDCGDQYQGDVNVLDMDTMTWSRLKIQGSSPGVRAGHAAVSIGTKVYIIGGVGDKRYYNDIWVFDICTCSWAQLDFRGQPPQGRFSHTAVVADMDIAIYGGCGEDERPLNELLVLHLGAEHPNGRYNISMCKVFGTYWNQEKRIMPRGTDTNSTTPWPENHMEAIGKWANEIVLDRVQPCNIDSGSSQHKRKRIGVAKAWDVESEQEEHSLSLSQHSSPSQSDQEQTPAQKANVSIMDSQRYQWFKQMNKSPSYCQLDNDSSNTTFFKNLTQRSVPPMKHQPKQEQYVHIDDDRKVPRHTQHLIGAEVRGKVDGAFDSGLLMTAVVNGRVFRGVLFAPDSQQVTEPCHGFRQPVVAQASSAMMRGPTSASLAKEHEMRSDLQGLVLTLGGPASANHASS